MKKTTAQIQKKYYLSHKDAIRKQNKKWLDSVNGRLSTLLSSIKSRCNNKNVIEYKYYGGKGIECFLTVQDLRFLWERDQASNMKNPSINRTDTDNDYCVENCEFVEKTFNCAKVSYKNSLRLYLFKHLSSDDKKKLVEISLSKKEPVSIVVCNIIKQHFLNSA